MRPQVVQPQELAGEGVRTPARGIPCEGGGKRSGWRGCSRGSCRMIQGGRNDAPADATTPARLIWSGSTVSTGPTGPSPRRYPRMTELTDRVALGRPGGRPARPHHQPLWPAPAPRAPEPPPDILDQHVPPARVRQRLGQARHSLNRSVRAVVDEPPQMSTGVSQAIGRGPDSPNHPPHPPLCTPFAV